MSTGIGGALPGEITRSSANLGDSFPSLEVALELKSARVNLINPPAVLQVQLFDFFETVSTSWKGRRMLIQSKDSRALSSLHRQAEENLSTWKMSNMTPPPLPPPPPGFVPGGGLLSETEPDGVRFSPGPHRGMYVLHWVWRVHDGRDDTHYLLLYVSILFQATLYVVFSVDRVIW